MTLERKIFEPGVYDITNDEYHASAGVSRTGIMEFKKSPKHFWHKYFNPDYQQKKKSAALEFGGALHPYILERDKFDKEFFIAKSNPYHGSSTAGKQFKADMIKEAAGRNIIDEDAFALIKSMASSVLNDDYARELITEAKYEKSIYWIDPDTQLLCKCRPDIWHDNFIVDLKTTKDAYRPFQRDFYLYGYHLQIAMIHEGIKHTENKEIVDFIDLALEKFEPFIHVIYPIDESTLHHGIAEFKQYLARLKDCLDSNIWPSYQSQTLSLPGYATIED